MKAVMISRYGAPDALKLTEVDRPEPGPEDVFVTARSPISACRRLPTGRWRGLPGRRTPTSCTNLARTEISLGYSPATADSVRCHHCYRRPARHDAHHA